MLSYSCDTRDYSLPGSSVHGILQARILEWVAFPYPGDLLNPGIKPGSPAFQADSLPTELWLTEGETGSILMGGAMFSKSLINFLLMGGSSVIYLGPKSDGCNEDSGDLLQKVSCMQTTLSIPSPVAIHCLPMSPLETPGHLWASLGQSLVGSLLLSPGFWCAQSSVCLDYIFVNLLIYQINII